MKAEIRFNDNPKFYTDNYLIYLDFFVTYMYSRSKKQKERIAHNMDLIRCGLRPLFIEERDVMGKDVRKNKKRGTK